MGKLAQNAINRIAIPVQATALFSANVYQRLSQACKYWRFAGSKLMEILGAIGGNEP